MVVRSLGRLFLQDKSHVDGVNESPDPGSGVKVLDQSLETKSQRRESNEGHLLKKLRKRRRSSRPRLPA
jgi:hypothetical protein